MRLIFLSLFVFLISLDICAQEGPYIYIDENPDLLYNTDGDVYNFFFRPDINSQGIFGFKITQRIFTDSNIISFDEMSVVTGIALDTPNFQIAKLFQYNDTIDNRYNFSNTQSAKGGACLETIPWSNTIVENAYIGFRYRCSMANIQCSISDTCYGWIRMEMGDSVQYFIVKDYAYTTCFTDYSNSIIVGNTHKVSISENPNKRNNISWDITGDQLTIDIKTNNYKELFSCKLFDLAGKLIYEAKTEDKTIFYINRLKPGIYILHVNSPNSIGLIEKVFLSK